MTSRLGISVIVLLGAAFSMRGQVTFLANILANILPANILPANTHPASIPPGNTRRAAIRRGAGHRCRSRDEARESKTQESQVPTETLAGMLRRMSSNELVLETDDKRVITIGLSNATKYLKSSKGSSPASAQAADFQPGDHLSVDTTEDDKALFHATAVTLVKQGTADERAAASAPVDTSPLSSTGPDDDDRPRLHRAPADSGQTPRAQITDGDTPPGNVASNRQATTIAPPPAPPDPDDPGPPKLQRGRPVQRERAPSAPEPAIAEARPSIHAEEVNGVTRIPQAPVIDPGDPSANRHSVSQPIRKSGDPVIDQAREAAFSFTETLPNYVVKQFTTRYQTEAARGGHTSWQPIDNVSADVVSEAGVEKYKNILINGKAPKEAIEKTGSWSTGEFASTLQDILSPATDAEFHNKRATSIVNRGAFRYDFSVLKDNSHWHVYTGAQSYVPEYSGAIWIDKENFRVLRIEMAARNMPTAFPLDTVESAVDYDYVMIGTGKFLLPVHSESLSCERNTSICSRNVIDFRNYRKFGADTSITFEPAEPETKPKR